eukprot:scaffold13013_cov128-Isochrysis_galbana.AAC.8
MHLCCTVLLVSQGCLEADCLLLQRPGEVESASCEFSDHGNGRPKAGRGADCGEAARGVGDQLQAL